MTMTRVVLATILSNLAAPVAFVLLALIRGAWDAAAADSITDWTRLLWLGTHMLPMAWLGMAIFVFPISLLAAIIGRAAGWRSLWIYVAIGAATGVTVHLCVLPLIPRAEPSVEFASIYAAIGGLCGWIYWRIAIRGSARAPMP